MQRIYFIAICLCGCFASCSDRPSGSDPSAQLAQEVNSGHEVESDVAQRAFPDTDGRARHDTWTFSTKGHPKAKGVNFEMSLPESWHGIEGQRPNMVQLFQPKQDDEPPLPQIAIVTKSLGLPDDFVLTQSDVEDLFAIPDLCDFIPPEADCLSSQSTRLEDEPAAIIEYVMRFERIGVENLVQTWSINFVQDRVLVQIGFSVTGIDGQEEQIAAEMNDMRTEFFLIANSIVFPEKWNRE